MTPQILTRRGFLGASAALGALSLIPATARAASPLGLTATSRVLDVDGRAASVYGIANSLGGQGLVLNPGEPFQLSVTNGLDVETILHWHGQIPPNAQDGVPDMPMPLLKPGETRAYDFEAAAGTHWMHSHVPIQEMQLLAAPLIVRRPEDLRVDRQEVTMFLHDFSFRPPEEVLDEIRSGKGHDEAAEAEMSQPAGHDMGSGMAMNGMSEMSGMSMPGMTGMADGPERLRFRCLSGE
jgi:FtsP/CotA-like multicopper oxidase with cupredoxin domain